MWNVVGNVCFRSHKFFPGFGFSAYRDSDVCVFMFTHETRINHIQKSQDPVCTERCRQADVLWRRQIQTKKVSRSGQRIQTFWHRCLGVIDRLEEDFFCYCSRTSISRQPRGTCTLTEKSVKRPRGKKFTRIFFPMFFFVFKKSIISQLLDLPHLKIAGRLIPLFSV